MRVSVGRLSIATALVALLVAGLSAPVVGQSSQPATAMHVALKPDGSARWTVSERFPLTDANDTAAFDRLANEYVTGKRDVLSPDPFRSAAAAAGQATGREMAISDVARGSDRQNGTGVLRLTFTWSNFTRVANGGQRLVLGDVFTSPTDTWLPGLREGQILVIEFPAGYSVRSSSRALDNGSIRIVGPTSFDPGNPSVTLQRTGPVTTTPGDGTPLLGIGVPSALSALAVLAIVLAAAVVVYRRRGPDADPAAAAPDEPPSPPPDQELLSDEERVLRLLRSEGGRMRQVAIVEETDWSNAKVSQLLSAMAEAGRIEKLRLGRENLISLPEEREE